MVTKLLKKILIWANRKAGVNMSINTLSTPLLIANTLLDRASRENEPMTHLKLQKLIYFVYKRYLKEYGKALFSEFFQVWTHGPVLRSVYDEFKGYAANPINGYIYSVGPGGTRIKSTVSDDETKFYNVLNWVWFTYSKYGALELREFTHIIDGAWDKAKNDAQPYIKDELIKAEEWVGV